MPPSETKKIFILRNNDLGDVLFLTTPLVRGLKKNFPEAKVFMGVGGLGEAIGGKQS